MSGPKAESAIKSELFGNRLEHVSVVPIGDKVAVDRILRRNGYTHQKNEHIATTYFSTNTQADILQWNSSPGVTSVLRFRQRFDTPPYAADGSFVLSGGGDLEIKIHDSQNPKNTKKKSIHIPGTYGVEKLIKLSNDNPHQLAIDLEGFAKNTQLNGIDVQELIVQLQSGLRVLTTKTAVRDIYGTRHKSSRVTIDTQNGFFGYPYLHSPVYSSVKVAERNDIAKIDLKYPTINKIGFDRLIAEIAQFATHEKRAETGMTFTQMREKALKKSKTIIKEQADFEFESKFTISARNEEDIDIHELIKNIHSTFNQGLLPGYHISQFFPYYEVRTGDSARRTIYGWMDEDKHMHEVFTLIEVEGDPPSFWIKEKGDPENKSDHSMKRREHTSVATTRPDLELLAQEASTRLGKNVFPLPAFRKEKIAFKVEEVDTGRMFVISLDKSMVENEPTIPPLVQMEVEYAETPAESIPLIPSHHSLQQSCEKIQSALMGVEFEGVIKEPTYLRKIDWLALNTIQHTHSD